MKTKVTVEFKNGKFWVSLESDSSVAIWGNTPQEAFSEFVKMYPEFFPPKEA